MDFLVKRKKKVTQCLGSVGVTDYGSSIFLQVSYPFVFTLLQRSHLYLGLFVLYPSFLSLSPFCLFLFSFIPVRVVLDGKNIRARGSRIRPPRFILCHCYLLAVQPYLTFLCLSFHMSKPEPIRGKNTEKRT